MQKMENKAMSQESKKSCSEYDVFVNKLKLRKSLLLFTCLIGIPGCIYLSSINGSGVMDALLHDVLFFVCMLLPAIATYMLSSMLFTRSKSIIFSVLMFIPTIVLQVVIFLSLWVGVTRAIKARKIA
jgi:hypothetical protein